MPALVQEYEVFTNTEKAVAFFFYKQDELDHNPPEGPFYFVIEGSTIYAGTKEHHVVLNGVADQALDNAYERGNIMLMEFEDQQPVRSTPCYMVQSF